MGIGKEIPIGKAVEEDAPEVEGHGRHLPDPASLFRPGTAGTPRLGPADPVTDRATAEQAAGEPEVTGHHAGSADAPASELGDRARRRDG